MNQADMLRKRVAKLERENRIFKFVGAGLLASMALFLIGVRSPRTVETDEIVLRDTRGRARITIGTPKDAGAAIDMKPDDPAIWLSDDKGTDRAILTADGIYFADSNAKRTMDLTSDPQTGVSILKFYDQHRKVSWSTPQPNFTRDCA